MNSRSDPAANEFINPNTTADAGRTPPEEGDNPPDEEGDSPENPPEEPRPSGATRGIVLAAVDRCMGRLCLDAQRNAKKPAAFMLWLDTYPDKHRAAFAGLLLPATDLFLEQHKDQLPSEADSAEIACGWLSEIFATVHKALAPLVDPPHAAADLVANVEAASEGLLADCGSLTDSLLEMELSP